MFKHVTNRMTQTLSQKDVWLKRISATGFVFFLIKGVLWLLLPLIWFTA